jgi:hypothetical protein
MALLTRRAAVAGAAAFALAPPVRLARAAQDPAPLAEQGYRLTFAEEFDTLDIGDTGHRWAPRLWYEPGVSADHYACANSVLTLRLLRQHGVWQGINIATEWTDTKGGTFFKGGYFAARMKLPRAWPAFWLFSVNHSRNVTPRADDPTTQCAEIDIFEGDSARPKMFCGTLHSNTGSYGGIRDQFNRNNCDTLGQDLTLGWHVISALWTQKEIVWYCDERETHRIPAYPSTWQDQFIILGVQPGGILNGPVPDGTDPVELLVDWVRVWQPSER